MWSSAEAAEVADLHVKVSLNVVNVNMFCFSSGKDAADCGGGDYVKVSFLFAYQLRNMFSV